MASETFPLEYTNVPGSQALATWERMKGDGGGWPIVVGEEESLARMAESISFLRQEGHSAESELAAAMAYRFPESFRRRRAEEEARLRREHPELGDDEFPPEPERGPWPEPPPSDAGLHLDRDVLSGNFLKSVGIVRLPTRDWTEAPAHLAFGGWNECPLPHEHVAAFRSWRERYGVELAGMSGDVVTMRAARRPSTREEALSLAQEQYEYCADIVDQGTGTLENLAAILMAHDWWFFWWD